MLKKNLVLVLSIIFINANIKSQTNAELITVQLEAITQTVPPQITLNWINDGSATGYNIYRRANTVSAWGSEIATLGAGESSFIDNTIVIGNQYEYKVFKSGTVEGYGYINTAIELPEIENRGILILVVEDTYIGNTDFDNSIDQTISDIENDGWIIERVDVNRNDAVTSVKSQIVSIYNLNQQATKAIYLIGHVPVPYSGLLNPDGHANHLGAWPTDMYYAEINGTWTDVSVNDNTSAAQPRNHNIPGDGKFDHGITPSSIDLEIGRVDFANMNAFSETEEVLLIKYLNKAHAYKTKEFTATERALVDDNFTSMTEGFSSSGIRNFSTMFTSSNINSTDDYRTEMSLNSYMWSYGCGAGSYTSCNGIGTTSDFAGDSLQTIFTMLFGSYFGDWDSDNNYLRAAIAQGQTLNSFWAGRPQWQVHHMALGGHIGFSTNLTQNNNGLYFVSTLSYFGKWIHIALMGDPTVRMHYISPPSNLLVVNNSNDADLTWSASPDVVLGYNVYRLDPGSSSYIKVNSSLISTTNFTDNTITSGGENFYIVKAVDLKTTASGSYYNQSIGVRASDNFTVSLSEININSLLVYPNPAKDKVFFSKNVEEAILFDLKGKKIISGKNTNMLNVSNLSRGIYLIKIKQDQEEFQRKLVIE